MDSLHIWNGTNQVKLLTQLPETIRKLCSIDNHLFLLTVSSNFYHGSIECLNEEEEQVKLHCVESLKFKDIDCTDDLLYAVDLNGNILIYSKSLELQSEVPLVDYSRQCCHGHTLPKYKVRVKSVSVGNYGNLYITENGELWGSGKMNQIGIDSPTAKKVTFFDNRLVYACTVGNDFAIAIVSKQIVSDDTDTDNSEDVFVSSCPHCLSASPMSQNSFSDLCPLGLPMPVSYDIETTSTSSKNDSASSCTADDDNKDDKEEKLNIIFRNTEAAKEFLSRQFSWMSSAGEEYLVECTEKPTRIIKENVSSMANLVFEGVKTVGGKVVTLSRHVSGSSENNEILETVVEEMHLPRITSKDEFLWSFSQGLSEKEASECGLQDRCHAIINSGAALINCEVWTWGNIVHGQLGIGDIIRRERPMIITKLSNNGAYKVSVQNYHAGILTLDGRGFLWGKNDQNQVTTENRMDQSSPRLFPLSPTERIKDLACGNLHTTLLTTDNVLKYIGKHSEKNVKDLFVHSLPIENGTSTDSTKVQEPLSPFVESHLLSSKNFVLLNIPKVNFEYLVEHLVSEQKFLEEMLVVHTNLIKPLLKKLMSLSESALYERFCREYVELLHFTAANVKSLMEFSDGIISENDVVMIKACEEHLYVCKNYLSSLHCVVSIGGCLSIGKLIDIPQCLYKLCEIARDPKRDKKSEEIIVHQILTRPLKRLRFYENLVHLFAKKSPKLRHDLLSKWTLFNEEQEFLAAEAQATKEFWMSSGKVVEQFKAPNRRLIRESHKSPIFLQNGGRFSTHWFILLNDIFVHVNGSTPICHQLSTIWVELSCESTNGHISLKMPEDSIELCAQEPEQKNEWYSALQTAIKAFLGKGSALHPSKLRSATYTFTKSGYYKDAKYTGRWLNGKMHGPGKLEWPDGRVYTGEFNLNQMHGFGRFEEPNKGVYEGQWKENSQNGFGIYKFISGDLYKGYFKDSLPHGHGCLRQGHFMAHTASIYIGDWIMGNKTGYGIIDDIATGEKYLGSWLDNKKHGNGLIVTSEGIYYEGVFNQDILTGHGIMILEDGTHYEGEFKGTGILNGKGLLTLRTGHTLEGSLVGSWNEGIKISNGVLSLPKVFDGSEDNPKSFGAYCTPPNQKWKGLFRQCHQLLGIPESNDGVKNNVKPLDTQKIWQNVAVAISNTQSNNNKKSLANKSNAQKLENTLSHLDVIPQSGKESLSKETYLEVKKYLIMAFECSHHPLGLLLNDLTAAYSTAYGTRAHALLLTHAVNELHFITKRLYDIIRLLFPALPNYGKDLIVDENDEENGVISCQLLLYPIILPKVHLSLFTLYTLRNKVDDAQYWKRLLEWNKQPDYTLMAFLHVDQKFLKTESETLKVSPVADMRRDQTFAEAVETLQLLKTTFSPMEKLLVIKQTFRKMTEHVQEQMGHTYRWNMDDLLPVFLYVVVRARILQLGSELDFVEDFMEPSLESGELGIMFTTLKACYQQILQEKLTIN